MHIKKKVSFLLPNIFFILLIIQISIGALVSGLDGGQVYTTWPLMNDSFFPDDSSFNEIFSLKSFEKVSLVQFIHRNLAYLIFILFLIMLIKIYRNKELFYLKKNILTVFIFLTFQIFLGIITVLSGATILYASLHQIGSILLLSITLLLVYKNYKTN